MPSVDGTGIDPTVLAEKLLPALTQPAPRRVTATLGPVPAAFKHLPIAYNSRGWKEGKKIGPRDAFRALWCIVRYAFWD